jgi:hypothetical protein
MKGRSGRAQVFYDFGTLENMFVFPMRLNNRLESVVEMLIKKLILILFFLTLGS